MTKDQIDTSSTLRPAQPLDVCRVLTAAFIEPPWTKNSSLTAEGRATYDGAANNHDLLMADETYGLRARAGAHAMFYVDIISQSVRILPIMSEMPWDPSARSAG
jgi:hypothetical protein